MRTFDLIKRIISEIFRRVSFSKLTSAPISPQRLSRSNTVGDNGIYMGESYDSQVLSALSLSLRTELQKIVSNRNYGSQLRAFFETFSSEMSVQETMGFVAQKMQQAKADGKSHSLMIQDSLHPIMISISVWPECDLDSLPARFRSEIGVNYFKAADSYRNKSFSMGAKGFTHLFFCFNRTNCGVAVAFFPCDQSYDDQGMIIPESIYRDEMPRQR